MVNDEWLIKSEGSGWSASRDGGTLFLLLPFTLHPLPFTFYFPIPLKYPDYHLEMRQWRQMRQMRHFFCTLVFSGLDGQKRVPLPKNRKSVAFRHTLPGRRFRGFGWSRPGGYMGPYTVWISC